MYIFGDFTDPFGIYGNMQEVPHDDADTQKDEDELIKDCVLRGALMLAAMILGLVFIAIISVLF